MVTAWLRRLTPLLILALLAGAVALLHHELSAYHYEDVRRAIHALRAPADRDRAGADRRQLLHPHRLRRARAALPRPAARRTGARRSRRSSATPSRTTSASRCSAGPRRAIGCTASWGLPPSEISLLIGFTAATLLGRRLCRHRHRAGHRPARASPAASACRSPLGRVARRQSCWRSVRGRRRAALVLAAAAHDPRLDGPAAAPAHRPRAAGGRRRRLAGGGGGAVRPDADRARRSPSRHFAALFVVAQVGRRQQPRAGRARRLRDRHPARPRAARASRRRWSARCSSTASSTTPPARDRDRCCSSPTRPPAQRAAGGGSARSPGAGCSEMAPRVMALAIFASGALLLFSGAAPPPRRPARHAAQRPARCRCSRRRTSSPAWSAWA